MSAFIYSLGVRSGRRIQAGMTGVTGAMTLDKPENDPQGGRRLLSQLFVRQPYATPGKESCPHIMGVAVPWVESPIWWCLRNSKSVQVFR